MGEAKRRRDGISQRLESALGCVYCGGIRRATTIDHMPPRAVFAGRLRPKGLEFPSCDRCNGGTKATDQVVAMMSRINPDDSTPEALAEVRKYLQGVANNEPDLLREMAGPPQWRIRAQERAGPSRRPLYVAGPMVSGHMERFAAKFGFAMHYQQIGTPLPETGAVAARWYSNADILEGSFPMEAWEVLGPVETLRQGKFQVSDQFEYAWAIGEDRSIGMYLGTFRHSFAVLAFSALDVRRMAEISGQIRVWRPGDLAS